LGQPDGKKDMAKHPKAYLNSLISLCRQGNDKAWHELIDLVGPVIFSICRKSRLTRDESFDIFGRVSLQLVNSINSLKSPEKVLSFVATITRRQIYNFYQSLQVLEYLDDQNFQSVPDQNEAGPEQLYEVTEKRQILMEAMKDLPERDYRLINMLFFDPDEPSYKEIATRLKMPVSSIGPVRMKVLNKLYRILKKKKPNFGVFSDDEIET
jgi:RNA polymerase sigma factor (sigma-70 family)